MFEHRDMCAQQFIAYEGSDHIYGKLLQLGKSKHQEETEGWGARVFGGFG